MSLASLQRRPLSRTRPGEVEDDRRPTFRNVRRRLEAARSWGARRKVFEALHTLNVVEVTPSRSFVTEQRIVTTGESAGAAVGGTGFTRIPLVGAAQGALVHEIILYNQGGQALEILYDALAARAQQAGLPLASGAVMRERLAPSAVFARAASSAGARLTIIELAF